MEKWWAFGRVVLKLRSWLQKRKEGEKERERERKRGGEREANCFICINNELVELRALRGKKRSGGEFILSKVDWNFHTLDDDGRQEIVQHYRPS